MFATSVLNSSYLKTKTRVWLAGISNDTENRVIGEWIARDPG
jgi:hypothetical protein